MLKVRSHLSYGRVGTDSEMPRHAERDDSFQLHICEFWYAAVSTGGPNDVTVLRFGEHNRIQAIFQEGHLRTTDPRLGRQHVHASTV